MGEMGCGFLVVGSVSDGGGLLGYLLLLFAFLQMKIRKRIEVLCEVILRINRLISFE